MTDLELFNLMRPIIMDITGVPECIMTDPNEKAPSGPYAAFKPKRNTTNRGQPNVTRKNGVGATIDVKVEPQLITECVIDFYRTGARDYAQLLEGANKYPDVSRALFLARTGWQKTGPMQDLTALQADNQEERSQISVFLMYSPERTVAINSIERVRVDVEDHKARQLDSFEIKTPDAP